MPRKKKCCCCGGSRYIDTNLVKEGKFDVNPTTYWQVENSAWVIDYPNERVNSNSSEVGYLLQNIPALVAGEEYTLEFDVDPSATFTGNGIVVSLGGLNSQLIVIAPGHKVLTLTADNANKDLLFTTDVAGDFIGWIDNISLVSTTSTLPLGCVDSIGGVSGEDYLIDGLLIINCIIFKGI